ncbi:MAG TPA: DUF429 domain-containing protein [Symbiobacteriaceae bacterium]|nr:DUF429 domain-containing protein [Symbiobacteriaceae bacterium]
MTYAGVDGCPAGWVVATLPWDGARGEVTICPTFAGVVRVTAEAELTLVDIPMGLDDRRYMRACCQWARDLLGPRRSSIFAVPVRAAVHAPDYAAACAVNQAATGRKLSVQSWNICRKIKEADLALRAEPGLQARLRESHPELCFTALNEWQPPVNAKKSKAGQAERLALLARHIPEVVLPAGFPRTKAAPDDILDALVLAVSARLAAARGTPAVPFPPEADALGLRMEMVIPYPPLGG